MQTRFGPHESITAAILAGGRGERMGGVDKGLQLVHGRPLVAWVIDALRAQGIANMLIVANRSFDRYAQFAPTIADEIVGHPGPLAGVAAALAACTTPCMLSVPVDCPDPPPDLVARLNATMSDSGVAAVVADDGERRQPLFALYRRELAGSAALAVRAASGVSAWQDSLPLLTLGFADRRTHFVNLNTPAELAAFEEHCGG